MKFKKTKIKLCGFKLNIEQYLKFQFICAYYNVTASSVLNEFIKNYNNLHAHVCNSHPLVNSLRPRRAQRGKSETDRQKILNLPGIKEG